MKRKIYTLLMLAFFALTSQTALASSVEMVNIGSVDFGNNVTVRVEADAKGKMQYTLRAKDGNVLRALLIDQAEVRKLEPGKDFDALLQEMQVEAKKMFRKKDGSQVIASDLKMTKLSPPSPGENKALIGMGYDLDFFSVDLGILLVQKESVVKRVIWICANGDAQYWKPALNKLIDAVQVN